MYYSTKRVLELKKEESELTIIYFLTRLWNLKRSNNGEVKEENIPSPTNKFESQSMQINPLRTFLIIRERYALIPYKIKHESRRNIQLGNELKTQIKYLCENKILTYNKRCQKLAQTFSHTSWFKKTGLHKKSF